MFLLEWFYGILGMLGLSMKEAKSLFFGLDNGGKNHPLLKDEMLSQHKPTQHPTSEELCISKIKFKAFEVAIRSLGRVWRDYYTQVDAVVYVTDAAATEKLPESKTELDTLLSDDTIARVPFLILGNKIDIPCAASEVELRYHLWLTNCTTGKEKVDLRGTDHRNSSCAVLLVRWATETGLGGCLCTSDV